MAALPTLVDASPRMLGDRQVGAFAFGCWRFTNPDRSANQSLIESALDAGCTLIDTADVYGLDWGGSGFGYNEELLGDVLRSAPRLRDRMVLATKGGIRPPVPYDSSPASLRAACEESLRRLGTDHVDLYQIHRPDLLTHPHVVANELDRLAERGLIGAVGVSNHSPSQTAALAAFLRIPVVSIQPELSLANLTALRDGTIDQAMAAGQAVLAWSPLGGGSLADPSPSAGTSAALTAEIRRLADREQVPAAIIAYGFLLALPCRPIVILGTQRVERLTEAWAAANIHLDRADVYALIQASDGRPLP